MSKKSVANRLRAYARFPYDSVTMNEMKEFDACTVSDFLNKVADEIDAEEAEMRGFCKRVEEAAKNREDLDVFGTEYMALPLDKNGEPWHVGDVINYGDGGCKVVYISPTHVRLNSYDLYTVSVVADKYEHYKEPTVEDVLMVLINEVCGDSSPDDEIIAKYAAKLQLKED